MAVLDKLSSREVNTVKVKRCAAFRKGVVEANEYHHSPDIRWEEKAVCIRDSVIETFIEAMRQKAMPIDLFGLADVPGVGEIWVPVQIAG